VDLLDKYDAHIKNKAKLKEESEKQISPLEVKESTQENVHENVV